jgi:hypothetical protein
MNASFEEKSAWIQLVGMITTLGFYFAVATRLLAQGITDLRAFVPIFIVAVIVMVAVLVAGHVLAALVDRPAGPDERDRLIGWRAESNASWIVAVGVLTAITGLVLSVGDVWIAHLLMVSLFLSEIVKYACQLVYYRRGM